MTDWITRALAQKCEGRCLDLTQNTLSGTGRVVALAPHPDDPDAVAVTLRMLQRGGWELYWSVLTSGWSGVEDSFVGPQREAKSQARESEQKASAAAFGLPSGRLEFLRLHEDEAGEMAQSAENRSRLFSHLSRLAPDVVVLPHGNDTNATHRLTHRWFTEWARRWDRPLVALANEDPKTTGFRPDLQVVMGAADVAWKASILECHRSQSLRNRAVRGITFAERILSMNRRGNCCAERFQLAAWNMPDPFPH